jgi:pyridoxamine 5'-phosphate oxidase
MADSPQQPAPSIIPQDLRVDYGRGRLDEADVAADPFRQFGRWFDDARAAQVAEPNAMTLATADASGAPSARVVLLKSFDERGFTFHTNYDSRKGRELAGNPRAALCFYWQPLERQVRIEGTVERASREDSEAYFRTRPVAAQIGAWVSQQSKPIASRAELERLQQELEQRFAGGPVPLPEHWGGLRVVPHAVEFWQGRPSRLHDRLLYTRVPEGGWKLQRLSP